MSPLNADPVFKDFKPIRQTIYNGILGDIHSHQENDYYFGGGQDNITNVHEGTHGISGILSFSKYGNIPNSRSLYVLNNRYVNIVNPNIRYGDFTKYVPQSLRSFIFKKYFVERAGQLSEQVLYVTDEWNAYVNGSLYREEVKIKERGESVEYMTQLMVINFALLSGLPKDYDRTQFVEFIKFNMDRSFHLIETNDAAIEYWAKFKFSEDAKSLRTAVIGYLGQDFANKYELM